MLEMLGHIKKSQEFNGFPSYYNCYKSNFKGYIVQELMSGSLSTIEMIQLFHKLNPAYWQRIEKYIHLLYQVWFLRKLRIIHNDLKPDNILMNEKGDLFIGDFGVAAFKGINSSNIFGTPYLYSPRKSILKFLVGNYKLSYQEKLKKFHEMNQTGLLEPNY